MAILGRVNTRTRKVIVAAGTSDVILIPINTRVTVVVTPGTPSGSAMIEKSNSSQEDITSEQATWLTLSPNPISNITMKTIDDLITALRLTATSADAMFEITVSI